ncbi:oxidoreductase [Raoultibacter massiliensis]|uniref:oxidoreductase n=1 Tax=Raoultibacter massiliensis TaxID=1852371 RepID=UPI000C817A13|nr:oxidoreductase [Raoultibacter massiliensis]
MKDHAMVIDYEYCTNCHSCEVSCIKEKSLKENEWGIRVNEVGPARFSDGKWEWDYVPVPSRLCDLCSERLEQGSKPLCELHCLAAVISVIPISEVSSKLDEMNKQKVAVYLP